MLHLKFNSEAHWCHLNYVSLWAWRLFSLPKNYLEEPCKKAFTVMIDVDIIG